MFGKKFFGTVALSSATVSLVGSVGSFAEGTVKVVGNKEITEVEANNKTLLNFLNAILEECQKSLEKGVITKSEMAKSKRAVEKIRKDFLNEKYVDLDNLSSLDLESVFKESDYFYLSDHDDNTYCALILGRYRGKKMFGVVFKNEEGRFREDHVWIV